ncbi:hypothetical protein A9Q91_03370 [Candidatus Gracilibacteria bacterium 28_42_T64]|nr:hypothetical protein A9Q91_03370 [Candidatus Gracilibacteria bacterium 28_42_T64]
MGTENVLSIEAKTENTDFFSNLEKMPEEFFYDFSIALGIDKGEELDKSLVTYFIKELLYNRHSPSKTYEHFGVSLSDFRQAYVYTVGMYHERNHGEEIYELSSTFQLSILNLMNEIITIEDNGSTKLTRQKINSIMNN